MSTALQLDEEYRLTRAALVNAGIDMTDSIDALHREWHRWRDKLESRVRVNSATTVEDADQWWSHHLAQFRCLIDPLHVAARAERARKDQASSSRKTIS